MQGITFVRSITYIEQSHRFAREDIPLVLLPLLNGRIGVRDLSPEQQDALTHLLDEEDWQWLGTEEEELLYSETD